MKEIFSGMKNSFHQIKLFHFFKNKKKGFFVEIGAFDGLEGSNCYYFENMQAWDGIAVEASKNHFSKLKKNRKCHVLNFAISSE